MAQNSIIDKTFSDDSKNLVSVIGLGGCGGNIIDDMNSSGSSSIGLYKLDAEFDQPFDSIKSLYSHLTILTVGLDGQYGTNKLLELVNYIPSNDGSVCVVATMPYSFEGEERRKKAFETLKTFQRKGVTVVSFDNDRLVSMMPAANISDMNGPISETILRMINLFLRHDKISMDAESMDPQNIV